MEAMGSVLAQVALAVCVVIASVLFFLYQHTSASAAAGTSDAKPARAAKKAKPAPAPAKPQPPMLEVKVLYATTSGTSRRYADELRRDAFALHIAGFHLKITLVDLRDYAIDAIENETLCVFLLPTMAGGVPPESATLFCANVRDMATDFRVSKDALSKLSYAIFGLGSAEFDTEWCRVASDLDEHLHTLGATAITDMVKGDESRDMDAQFTAWRAQLWPFLCEMYVQRHGRYGTGADAVAAATAATVATGGCGGGSCGSGQGGGCGSGAPAPAGAASGFSRPSPSDLVFSAVEEAWQQRDSAARAAEAAEAAAAGVDSEDEEEDEDEDDDAAAVGAGAASAAGAASGGADADAVATGKKAKKRSKWLPKPGSEAAASGAQEKKPWRQARRERREAKEEAQREALAAAAAKARAEVRAREAAAAAAGGAGAASVAADADADALAAAAGVGTPAAPTAEDLLNDALLAEADEEYRKATTTGAGASAGGAASAAGGAASAERAPDGTLVADLVDSDDDDTGSSGSGGAGAAATDGKKKKKAAASASDGLADIEDMGSMIAASSVPAASAAAPAAASAAAAGAASSSSSSSSAGVVAVAAPQPMVTPAQYKALTKEGYRIIGTHSAVKICRWTKAQLRGRGGCYKHSFYGIQSFQCMEATPSLACANKCVFCWRHHKNPVGREWRWSVDAPEMIVEQAIEKHRAMVHELRGMPGVKQERWEEAHTVRHCALSLVGEPIMYPHVNTLIRLLHERNISSFMVTNAQFPECITKLDPVTQLYVSIDAATKETLRAIDRPLFKDFWERFLASLDALRQKRQRTVYRLTLVKGHNMTELEDYAALVARGQPDFIEVKGVTWCGTSPASNLTMADVPWHAEVRTFCEALAARLSTGVPVDTPARAAAAAAADGDATDAGVAAAADAGASGSAVAGAASTGAAAAPTQVVQYGLAAEHAHSCCVLLAKKSFFIDGSWHTHIDYPRFHELSARFYASGGTETFTSMDYIAKTPDWAVYDAPEGGFDPIESRWRRNKTGGITEIEYKTSESGCG